MQSATSFEGPRPPSAASNKRGSVSVAKPIRCPHCGAFAPLTPAGQCSVCQRLVTASSRPQDVWAAAGAEPTPAGPNPYNAPLTTDLAPPPGESPNDDAEAIAGRRPAQPFWRQAAVFSFYAPFVVVLMQVAIGALRTKPLHPYALIGLVVLGGIIVVAGVALGVVGLVGAARRRRLGLSLLAFFGVVLNAGFLALSVWAR